jgi:glycosyltransferase involved in cell wall biosynthesis
MAPAPRIAQRAVSAQVERLGRSRERLESGSAMSARPDVVYVLPDKMGGVLSIVANLLRYRTPDEFTYRSILTRNELDHDTLASMPLCADQEARFDYALPIENLYAVVKRLSRVIGPGPGVLVCNDFVELLLLTVVDPGRTVVQILHGDYDYYYNLAAAHEPLVHAFVAYSRTVYEKLIDRLPHRRDTIFWLPYGIPIPASARQSSSGPLRLIFVGRLDEAKGVFKLPDIDRLLRDEGVPVTWTIVGNGPARETLRAAWPEAPHVRWTEAPTPGAVAALCAEHDVFVLPSHAEGLSVATVEAMSVGLVPVISDLPSMTELLDGGRTGVSAPVGDAALFARAIGALARDRDRLETMSRAARQLAIDRFDIRARAASYQQVYGRWRELYRPRPASPTRVYGSRLDQRWIPNAAVKLIRTRLRRA